MQSCELVMSVSALACVIAEGKTPDELAMLGSIFNQLGDSLATITARESLCQTKDDDSSL